MISHLTINHLIISSLIRSQERKDSKKLKIYWDEHKWEIDWKKIMVDCEMGWFDIIWTCFLLPSLFSPIISSPISSLKSVSWPSHHTIIIHHHLISQSIIISHQKLGWMQSKKIKSWWGSTNYDLSITSLGWLVDGMVVDEMKMVEKEKGKRKRETQEKERSNQLSHNILSIH